MLHRNIQIYNLFDSYFFIYLNLYYEIIIKVTQKNNSIKVKNVIINFLSQSISKV